MKRSWQALVVIWLIAHDVQAQEVPKIEIVPQVFHSDQITSAEFCADDGSRIATGSRDHTVKLWQADSGRLIRTFVGHSLDISSVHCSPDGLRIISIDSAKTLTAWNAATGQPIFTNANAAGLSPDTALAASASGGITLWDTRNGTAIGVLEDSSETQRVEFSPSRDLVASAEFQLSGYVIRLWDVTGRILHTLQTNSHGVEAIEFSPDGSLLAALDANNINVWDTKTGRLSRLIPVSDLRVNSVEFSPDQSYLATGHNDGLVKLWNIDTGELVRTFRGHTKPVSGITFSPDGNSIMSVGDDSTKLWNKASGELLHTIATGIRAFATFSPDSARLLAGSWTKPPKLWDASTGVELHSFDGNSESVFALAFSPDGKLMLSGGNHGTPALWDVSSGERLRTFEGHTGTVTSLAFMPDGKQFVSASPHAILRVWDVGTPATATTVTAHNLPCILSGMNVAVSPGGEYLLAACGNWPHAVMLNRATGNHARRLISHRSGISAVAFTPDGRSLLSGSDDGTIKLWDAASGNLKRTFGVALKKLGDKGRITCISISPNGKLVASGGDDHLVKLWDASNGRLLRTFHGHSELVSSVSFSPSGTAILSSSYDGSVRIWDISEKNNRSFVGHSGAVDVAAFSPGGTRVVSGSRDATVRIWNSATADLLATLIGSGDRWLAITPKGFFDASDEGLDLISVVSGLEVFSVEQFRDQLQRKDLLQDLLADDPLRRYVDEASKLDLKKIVESGAPPTLEILEDQIERAGDTVRIKLRIFNNEGGGIGRRLTWRVNGQTQGETEPDALRLLSDPNGPVEIVQALKLDSARENLVSVTAHNGAGLLATLPLLYKIDRFGATPAGQQRPRMFILAIGVNGYVDPALPALKLAVNDVQTLARNFKLVAESGGYERAEIIERVEARATKDDISAAFADIAKRIERQDALIVLLAGHGKSVSGRYFYLPSGTRFGGPERRNVTTEGIPTETWERWIASIQVDKKLLVIDTCESSDYIPRGSKDELARETAVDRLRRSIGNSVITAARQVAYEGSRLGHGVLTYAVLEALGQSANPGVFIDVESVHQHVRIAVPRLSAELSGQVQEPFNKIVGNFPIGTGRPEIVPNRLPPTATQPGRYILVGSGTIAVMANPSENALANMQLEVPTLVEVFEFLGNGWVVIGRNGTRLGYVPSSSVERLKE